MISPKLSSFGLIEKKYNCKTISRKLKPSYVFFGSKLKDMTDKLCSLNIDFHNSYYNNDEAVEIKFKDFVLFIGALCSKDNNCEEYLEEKRLWITNSSVSECSKMTHQHLSNCVHSVSMLYELGRLSEDVFNELILNIEEDIVEELEERFDGKIKPFAPYFNHEKDLLKDYERMQK